MSLYNDLFNPDPEEEDNDNNKEDKHSRKPGRRGWIFSFVIAALCAAMIYNIAAGVRSGSTTKISYSDFITMLNKDQVGSVDIYRDHIVVKPALKKGEHTTASRTSYVANLAPDSDLVQRLIDAGVDFQEMKETSWGNILLYVVPLVLIYAFLILSLRGLKGGGIMGVGKSNAKLYMEKKTGVTFADVAGQDEAKESLTEMVEFLHNPARYTAIGARLPKGALLVGPPGTGKTLLAKAVAGEAGVPFFSLSGSSFVEMYVGVGASRVRDLFKKAEEVAPCIIFIDEIDAIGKSRTSDQYGGGNDEREQTLNQLLAEMDGFDSSKGLVILAATNRPEVLDKALLRPGRFDRRVIVEKPDLKGRIDTLKVHSRDVKMDETVDFKEVALATAGAVGSDLANMVNEAALNAVKNGRQAVSQQDLMEAVELVIAGKEKKDRILSDREKAIVANHEIGHALISALQKDSEPVQKITIVPRTMGSLGYVMQFPEEEKFLQTRAEMEAELVSLLGGRAAEEVKFDTVTTGASNDIEKATELARAMITQYGMSEKFGMVSLESVENRYLDGRPVMNCSDETAFRIDKEVQRMIKYSYKKAVSMIRENESTLDALASYLIEKESITGREFMDIFHKVQKGGHIKTSESEKSGKKKNHGKD